MMASNIPGVPVPLHPAPFACARCGETLLYNYVPRAGAQAGDGYYFFAHLIGDRLFSYTIEKSHLLAMGGLRDERIIREIEGFTLALHELIGADSFPEMVAHMWTYSAGGPRDGA